MRTAWIVFKKELLNFIRDKNTLIYSIILPIALYPLIFWVMNQIMTLQQGSLSEMPTRIAFVERPDDSLVFTMYESDYDLELIDSPVLLAHLETPTKKDLENLGVDVIISSQYTSDGTLFKVVYDSSSDRSSEAKSRIDHILEEYRLIELSQYLGMDKSDLKDLQILKLDLSSRESRSRFLLGIILPMIVVIITVMGGLYPSIEVITSERERKTIETTLVSPVNETSLVMGKFAAVIAMSATAGLLNIVAMLLTLRHTLFSGMLTDFEFTIPFAAIPMIIIGILLIAATFGALMILVAAFAEDFKEAQSLVSPIYAVGIQPAVVAAIPGVPFNNATALIPVSNISLLFRSLIQGNLEITPAIITLGSLFLWCFLLLYLARRLLRRDAVVMGLNKNQVKTLFGFKTKRKGA